LEKTRRVETEYRLLTAETSCEGTNMKRKIFCGFFMLILLIMGSAAPALDHTTNPGRIIDIRLVTKILPGTMDFSVDSSANAGAAKIPVTIYTPPGKKIRGDILLLPGWKFSRHGWLNETEIKRLADKNGFRLVCPEMNVTIYESRYFPETTLKWADTPGLKWIHEIFLPAMKSKGLFQDGRGRFVLGLSTGGRGAVLVALDNPGMFNAAAALSGDFDQTEMPRDNLMTAVYGSFQKFPERWRLDNPVQRAKDWKIPLYLAHGTKDAVVPPSQTKLFYTVLRNLHVALDIRLEMPESRHDYLFWNSQLGKVMDFFNQYAP